MDKYSTMGEIDPDSEDTDKLYSSALHEYVSRVQAEEKEKLIWSNILYSAKNDAALKDLLEKAKVFYLLKYNDIRPSNEIE